MDVKEKINQFIDRWGYLFLIFLIGCLGGWIYEEFFYWFTEGMLRNRGIMYGPWLPIYGIGALGFYALKPLKKNPVILFLACSAVSAVVEYIIGYVGIQYLGIRLWDYRGLFLNLNGIICFRSIMSFAVMGLLFHYIMEPAAAWLVGKAEKRTVRIICITLFALFVADAVLSALFRTPITY